MPTTAGPFPANSTSAGSTAKPVNGNGPPLSNGAVRVVRFDEAQLTNNWAAIAAAIAASTPPHVNPEPFVAPDVFRDLIAGKMQVWALVQDIPPHERGDGQARERVCMLCVTRWVRDMGAKYLGIYALHGYEPRPGQSLKQAFEVIARYAKGGNASGIIAYSNAPAVLAMAESLGADTSWRLIHWPLGESTGDSQ